MADAGRIRAGVGGWTFEPWRGVFYPKGLKQAQELDYASRHLTAIEIIATFLLIVPCSAASVRTLASALV